MQLHLSTGTTSEGVVERDLTVGGVPGVLWSPVSPTPGSPLLLLGHGGGLHKGAPGLVARAREAVQRDGFSAVAIDAPGHGDRDRSDEDRRWIAEMRRVRETGRPLGPVLGPFNRSLADRAVPEWRAVIDALQGLPEIGADARIGYSGMTLATAIGIPLAAADRRIRALIVGGSLAYPWLLEAARRVTVPVEVLVPWDDPELDRASGFALFDALASEDKTLHAFPGSHFRVPADRFDTRFFARHLGAPEPVGRR
ncbi:alpha/beta hydrolase [Amnibacterium sp.]|uniref:alpha/beta hydrolase n=1 Tax=Amnibacterium sp. TaxID=1872496 RepID=UPI002629F16B|nr:alpha/beta hydrolase [Amnibacterium sp.]MCU1473315.1 hypothetical protein [Amnibacterium sp.]